MLDRITNLLALLVLIVTTGVLTTQLYSVWEKSAPWEQEWVVKSGSIPSHPAETLVAGIRKATELDEYRDARTLRGALEADYKPSGKIFVRFTLAELAEAALATFISLLFAAVPISINYVRHGKVRVWNRGTQPYSRGEAAR